jgi:uncharacterized protein YndB with AHSA1/START domain
MHFGYTIVINQPVEKVFNYVSNPVNLPEWQGPQSRYVIYNRPRQVS